MIDRTPQVHHLAVHHHVHLVEMPLPVPKAADARNTLPPDIGCKHRAEAIPPVANHLMTNVDPTLEQQVLHVAQRQRETDIQITARRMTSGEELE